MWSAGSEPADQINLAAVQVMAAIDLDLSQEFPKPMTDEMVRAADVVIPTREALLIARQVRALAGA